MPEAMRDLTRSRLRPIPLALCLALALPAGAPALAQQSGGAAQQQDQQQGQPEPQRKEIDLTAEDLERLTAVCTNAVTEVAARRAPPASIRHGMSDGHVALILDYLLDPSLDDGNWIQALSQALNRRVERGQLGPIEEREPEGAYLATGVVLNLDNEDGRRAFAFCEFRDYQKGQGPQFARIRLARSEPALFGRWVGVPMF